MSANAGTPPPSNAPPDSATVRPLAGSVRAACQSIRQAVATVCRAAGSVRAGFRQAVANIDRAATIDRAASDSGEHRQAVRPVSGQAVRLSIRRPFDRAPRRHHRQAVRL